ncbi:LigB subunit of an aromatic-ring-opening dioxygenase LigAB [Auriscalpium vulgare]|uniref:LigB subunit of an aromatic-ring-opening dioxygenase LigAB n=1 Tax=Auriscalpium vulgare TaxID=40419 RepID=A0ACB8RHA1_9AGAM|nr:LigB subunit of an aromatic-ring-opening dioxygenase LigAB [Auriscalpium vulgare]
MASVKPLATFFFSHGSPRTLVDETDTTAFAQKIGEYARREGVQGVVWMAAHWETHEDTIEMSDIISRCPIPLMKAPVEWYEEYKINSSPALAQRCYDKLKDAGFNVSLNDKLSLMHLTSRMYPDYHESPPMTIMSVNGRFDPWFHLKIGMALRALRHDKILLIGTGGGVHNLYSVSWHRMLLYQDTLTRTKPLDLNLDGFGNSMKECVVKNSGPQLGRSLARLLAHPHFLQSNPTPEHFLPMVYAAGGCSTWDDDKEEYTNIFGGENWEMDTQLNVNFAFGLQKQDKIFSALQQQERNLPVSRLVESAH